MCSEMYNEFQLLREVITDTEKKGMGFPINIVGVGINF
jgi:hypothetical protein